MRNHPADRQELATMRCRYCSATPTSLSSSTCGSDACMRQYQFDLDHAEAIATNRERGASTDRITQRVLKLRRDRDVIDDDRLEHQLCGTHPLEETV